MKKSLKRKNDNAKAKIVIPNPDEDEEQTVASVQDTVDKFIEEHPDGWSFEEESQLRSNRRGWFRYFASRRIKYD